MTPSPPDINKPDNAIVKWHPEWKRNRDMIEGERSIKAESAVYLPRDAGLDDEQFRNILLRTPFTPGASRVHEGLMGLVFRKPPITKAPDQFEPLMATITSDGYTLDDLAEDVMHELLITNYVGLLTDYPTTSGRVSIKQAMKTGAVPVALMRARRSSTRTSLLPRLSRITGT